MYSKSLLIATFNYFSRLSLYLLENISKMFKSIVQILVNPIVCPEDSDMNIRHNNEHFDEI